MEYEAIAQIIILIAFAVLMIFRLFPNVVMFIIDYIVIPIAKVINKIKERLDKWLGE